MKIYNRTHDNVDYRLVSRQNRRAHIRAVLLRALRHVAARKDKVGLSKQPPKRPAGPDGTRSDKRPHPIRLSGPN